MKLHRLHTLHLLALLSLSAWAEPIPADKAPAPIASLRVTSGEEKLGSFETMSAAGSASEIIEHVIISQNGESILRHLPGGLQFDAITLSRPVTVDRSAWAWRALVETGNIETARRTVTIVGVNDGKEELATITLANCWPSALLLEQPAAGGLPREVLTLTMENFVLLLNPKLAHAKGLISSPADGAVYYVPQTLPLTVELSDNAAAAVRVRFLANGQVIGTDNDASDGFSLAWAAPAPGVYRLSAEVINATDGSLTTPRVNLTIKPQIQVNLSTREISGNLPMKSVVGIFNVTGTDASSVTLAPGTGDTQNASFSIDGMKRLITETVFDHRNLAAVSFRVKAVARDGIGGEAEQAYVFAVTDGPVDAGPRLTDALEIEYDAKTDTSSMDLHFAGGIYGRSYTVEVSEDLKEWKVVGRYIADETGALQLKDTVVGKPDRRFWRVVW